ncbi:MAG: type I restriction-modification enzyme R subunit C-terminal domain-containing protein [Chthoniobacterales bacterium]
MAYESEWLTRKRRIDSRLKATGWDIISFSQDILLSSPDKVAVEELPTANGPADYGLFVAGRLLGIVEAKKVGVNPQNVLEQAKRYAGGAFHGVGNWDGLRVPFLYASNGELIWHLDVRPEKLVSRQIKAFHSAEALQSLFERDLTPSVRWLVQTPPDQIGRLRSYQRNCISAVEKEMITGRRDLMVAMATGTGKTFLTVAQIYRLLESKLVRKVLFLVDRKALAAQAVREFNAFNTPKGNKFTQEYEVYSQRFQREDFGEDAQFDPKVLPNEYLTAPKSSHTFVYVSTIQRMVRNLFGAEAAFSQTSNDSDSEEDADKLDIPIHAFDLIIADECHRGYSAQELSLWRDTLQHFDAIRVGLTATPAAHTVALFGEPVFRYGVEQAIRDGYLVDYEAVAIKSKVRINGLFLKEGEQVGKIDTQTGEETFDNVEDERTFSAEDIEQEITAPDSNRKIIEEVAKHAYAHEEQTGRFPKILIFAVNDIPHASHADQLVRICREVFNQGDDFVQKITGNPNVDRPLQRIREFRNRPKPKVVVTVDMLSTGVDIPALEFIVFLRPVKSRILWEQMLGRGTRRCDDINKAKFVVFDCFDGTLIRYFKDVSNFRIESPQKPVLSIPQIIENIWQNIDRKYQSNVLVKRLQRIEKDMSGDARTMFAQWIEDGDVGKFASDLLRSLRENFTDTMKLLRNPKFQKLLVEYPRAKRSFWVSYDTQDEVTSRVEERFGKYTTASDYLEAFSKFVRENQDQITAIKILLERPKDWNPHALEQLRQTLRQHNFNEAKLKEAHARVYHKQLADIISMVKHAAREELPILSAEERVEAVITRIRSRHEFSSEQLQWLAFIQSHLVSNLSIDLDDLENQPVFADRGGVTRAQRLFGADLPKLIDELNLALAA